MNDFLGLLFWGFLGGFLLVFLLYRLWMARLRLRGRRRTVAVVMLQPVYLDGERVPPPEKLDSS